MIPYKNLSGDSGVIAYQPEPEHIAVMFKDGDVYTYSYSSAGKQHVEQMKTLAENGRGLATYINQHVKEQYERNDPTRP